MTQLAQPSPATRYHLSAPGILRSEWIKLRSLRSTWISLVVAAVLAIGLGVLFSALRGNDFSHHGVIPGPFFDPVAVSLRGVYLAQVAVGVLGVLLITGEYSTGMIRASLTAVPRRAPVLLAKTAVYAVASYVVAVVATFFAFLGGQAALGAYGFGVSLSSPGALRAVFGGALYLMVVGLLGLGLGFALRNTGGAIATLFGLLLILPALAQALPSSWQDHIDKYLPMTAGTQIMVTKPDAGSLSPWTGLLVFACYALAALVAGAIVLRRRDA
ncbi:MAG: ABC transporter permease [Jatrophihabitans sp.]|nr:MAG: ABC transporter permease [Jatrophihabitans sp.]